MGDGRADLRHLLLVVPQGHAAEEHAAVGITGCHDPGTTPGYVEYALSHGANLCVNVDRGRFVFYYICGHV